MNKNEFIHRAIIAQMANPYSWGSDNNPFRRSFSDIIEEARDMADFVEQEGIPFDPFPSTSSGQAPEEPEEEEEVDGITILRRYTEKYPFIVTRELHVVAGNLNALNRATADGDLSALDFNSGRVKVRVNKDKFRHIIKTLSDIGNGTDEAPDGSWLLFGHFNQQERPQYPTTAIILSDDERKAMLDEGRMLYEYH